jgi:hypothetical protein
MIWRTILHCHYLKKFILPLLIFFSAGSAFGDDPSTNKSLGLELDAAKRYLQEVGTGSVEFDTRFLSSLGINYTNTRNGNPDQAVNAWEAELDLDDDGKIFSVELASNLLGDDQHRSGIGEKLSLGGVWNYAKGSTATLTLSGGATRFSASESNSPTAKVNPFQRVDVSDTEAITQFNPSAELELSFFDSDFTFAGTFSRYRYQNYVQGSGLAGSGSMEYAAANLNNALISGFIDWEWSLCATLNLPRNYSLSATYLESLNLDTSSWTKSLEETLSKDFNKRFSGELGMTHATEGGSGDNTYKISATYNF